MVLMEGAVATCFPADFKLLLQFLRKKTSFKARCLAPKSMKNCKLTYLKLQPQVRFFSFLNNKIVIIVILNTLSRCN